MKAHRHTGCFQKTFRDRTTGELKKSPQWWVKFFVGGKPVYENANTEKVSEAVAYRNRRLAEVGTGKAIGLERVTLDDLLAGVKHDYTMNGLRSAACLGYRFQHLRDFLGATTKAKDITTDRLRAFAAHRKDEGASNASINRELSALRRAFKLAADRVGAMPIFPMLKEDNARVGFFEQDQLAKIEAAFEEPFDRVWVLFNESGWRGFSEILSRKKADIDLAGGWMTLDAADSKSGEARKCPISPKMREAIESQLAWSREVEMKLGRVIPLLFHTAPSMRLNGTSAGGPILQTRWTGAWRAAFKKAGVVPGRDVSGGRTPHDLRRTAARRFMRAGVSQAASMKLLGHKTDSIYRRYAIVDESVLTEASEKIAAFRAKEIAGAKPSNVVPITRNAG